MLSVKQPPKTKTDLIKSISSLQNPKIDCFDLDNDNERRIVESKMRELMRRGSVSVVLLSK